MKNTTKLGIISISLLLLLLASSIQVSAASSYVVYGKVSYEDTYTNGITVTVKLTYNSTTYETLTDTTYGGGKYQVELDHMTLEWNTSMTITVNATHGGLSDTSSAKTIASGQSMKAVNLAIAASSSSDDDESSSSTTSTTDNSGWVFSLVIVIGGGFIAAMIYLLFKSSAKPPKTVQPYKPRKTTKKKSTKGAKKKVGKKKGTRSIMEDNNYNNRGW